MLCGCQGVNGGGWAHYVGQEKVRPLTGFQQLAFGLDWQRPTRHMTGTSFFYLHTDQWRYERFRADEMSSPLGPGLFAGRSVRRLPRPGVAARLAASHPTFDRNPLDIADDAARAGKPVARARRRRVARGPAALRRRGSGRPGELPPGDDGLAGEPDGLVGQGHGVLHAPPARRRRRGAGQRDAAEHLRPQEVRWRETAPRAKLDLVTTMDFRMTSTCTYSDIVLPAATWYEKHDLSTTDMHPFVHSFNPAIPPPWEARTDFDAFHTIAAGVLPARGEAPGHAHGRDRRSARPRHRGRAGAAAAAACGTGRRLGARPCPA